MVVIDKLIVNLNQEYPIYNWTYREGTKYPYTTVHYRILDPEYILEPFTDAIANQMVICTNKMFILPSQ